MLEQSTIPISINEIKESLKQLEDQDLILITNINDKNPVIRRLT